jgi:hypothetical protein
MNDHFYSRFGLAVAMLDAGKMNVSDLDISDLSNALSKGLLHFRVKPIQIDAGEKVLYGYVGLEKGDTPNGVFMSPNIITSDKQASSLWKKTQEFIDELKGLQTIADLEVGRTALQLLNPLAGEYNNGKKSRQTAKITLLEALSCTIATITESKPVIAPIADGGRNINTAIIPDLPLGDLLGFINVFRKVSKFKTESLMVGKVSVKTEKSKDEKISAVLDGDVGDMVKEKESKKKFYRPNIYRGNFPNAPKSSHLSALSLLGAIGEWAKEADETGLGESVLTNLETCSIYLISTDDVKVSNFNHYVVKLSKEGRLSTVIDSIYHIRLYSLDRNASFDDKDRAQEKIAFFASRFLHLFDEMSFREFLALRAEYPFQLELLFNIFFMETKKIDPAIVRSAQQLGAWLNTSAYFAAKSEESEPNKVRDLKAKILVELESSAFSAKSGTALIAQTITRVGRLTNSEAPEGAQLFMEKTMSGEIELRDAQQLIMAFSRLRTKKAVHGGEQATGIESEFLQD